MFRIDHIHVVSCTHRIISQRGTNGSAVAHEQSLYLYLISESLAKLLRDVYLITVELPTIMNKCSSESENFK